MEGRGRKNKFKEQRHQGKWSALLQGLQEKEPWRKGSRGSGHQERLGGEQSTTQFLLCLCVCGAEQEWISGQVGVGRRDALLAHFWRGGGCVLEMMRASERAPVKETMFHGPRDGWPSLASPRAATKKKKKKQLTMTFTVSPGDHSNGSTQASQPWDRECKAHLSRSKGHSGKNQYNSRIRANWRRLRSYAVLARRPQNHE